MDWLLTSLLTIIWPLIGLLLGWWGSFLWLPNALIGWGALIGLGLGSIVGGWRWRSVRRTIYFVGWLPLLGGLLFYEAGLFGFMMGVPIFHCGLALPVGFYWGRRMKFRQFSPKETRKQRRRLVWIMGGVTAGIAAASGLIAWFDPYTLANLRGMLQLQLTRLFLKLVIWVGGILLVGTTMWLTRIAFTLGQKSIHQDIQSENT